MCADDNSSIELLHSVERRRWERKKKLEIIFRFCKISGNLFREIFRRYSRACHYRVGKNKYSRRGKLRRIDRGIQPRRRFPCQERYRGGRCCPVASVDAPSFPWEWSAAGRQVCRWPRWRDALLARRSARCGQGSSCSAMPYSVAMMCSDATSQRHFLIPGKQLFITLLSFFSYNERKTNKKEKKNSFLNKMQTSLN